MKEGFVLIYEVFNHEDILHACFFFFNMILEGTLLKCAYGINVSESVKTFLFM